MSSFPSSTIPGQQDDIPLTHLDRPPRFDTGPRHSTKIHDFFGLPSGASLTAYRSSGGMLDHAMPSSPSEPRSSTTLSAASRLSAKLREQYPTLKLHARRTQRSCSLVIQGCTPVWFTPATTLSTLALCLRLLPLSGLSSPLPLGLISYLPTALYLLSLVFFLLTSTLFLLRIILYPHATRRATLHERDTSGLELGYLSAWPTAWTLLVSAGAFAAADNNSAVPDSGALDTAVYICWWVGAVWAAGTALFVLVCLLSARTRSGNRTGGGRFAPLVGFLVGMSGLGTVAFVGGLVAWLGRRGLMGGGGGDVGDVYGGNGEGIVSAGLAAPVVLVSFCAAGAAWFTSNLVYGVLLHELVLVMGWPPPEHTATVFSLVGPLGQCASALVVLANAAGGGTMGGVGSVEPGMVTGLAAMAPLELVCVLLALMMGGMAFSWLLLGCIVVIYRASQRQLVWNPSWNGMPTSIATLAILSILLGRELDSPFFRVVACVIIILCALLVVINLGFTVRLAVVAKGKRDFTATGRLEEV